MTTLDELSDEEALDRLLEERVFSEFYLVMLDKVPKHMPRTLVALTKLPAQVFLDELTGGEAVKEKFIQ